MEAQQIKSVIERALLVHAGTTTGDGAGGGTTLVDSALASGFPDYNGQAVMIAEGSYAGQTRDIDGSTAAGTITVSPAYGGQIVSGINYYILSAIPQTAEVADIPAEGNAKTFNATALASINAEVDTALNTAIPGTPAAGSLNEVIKAIGDFDGNTNLRTLLAALGIPDTSAKPLYTVLVTDLLGHGTHGLVQIDSELGTIATAIGNLNNVSTAQVNTEVDSALDTAIPGSPTADSINERIKTLDTDVTAIKGLVDSGEAAGPFSYLDAGGEQDVVEDTATTRRHIWLDFSNRNMAQTGTFIIYRKVDGANYDVWATIPATVGAGDDRAWDAEFTTNQAWKLTYEEGADEGAARAIPYNVITQVIE